jgi:heme/copper-type cytochrome/quinol oxidase subunit 2
MTETVKNAVMSMKKMSVLIWCVTAIVVIVFLTYHYSKPTDGTAVSVPTSVAITAMTLVAALGGADVLKQRALNKGLV